MGLDSNESRTRKNKTLRDQKLTSKSLQESQLSVMLRKREKVDGHNLFEGENYHNFETSANDVWQRQQKHAPSKSMYDARQILAWDNTFITSPGVLEPEELRSLNFSVLEDIAILGKPESLQSEVSEPGSAKTLSENSRVSLAWDSAFFTSPGVLDPEELSLINKGCKKPARHVASRFQTLSASTESNLSVDSSNFSLDGLESRLFEDMASSSRKENTADWTGSSCKIQYDTISDKPGASSQTRMKPMPAPRRKNFRQGKSKMNTVAASQHTKAQKYATRHDEYTILSSLTPSKILQQTDLISLAPSRRDSLCAKHAKINNRTKLLPGQYRSQENLSFAQGRQLVKSKKTFSEELDHVALAARSTNPLSKSSPAPRFKAITSHISNNKSNGAASSTSYTHSTPITVSKSKTTSSRPKLSHSRNSNPAWVPSSHSYKSPTSSFKSAPRGCSLKSSVTPVKHRSCKEDLNPNCLLWKSVISEGDASLSSHIHPNDALAVVAVRGNQEATLPDKCTKKVLASPSAADEYRSLKTSALRIPSPRIGYFDQDKFLLPSTVGALQFDSCEEIISSRTRSENGEPSHRPDSLQTDQATEPQNNLVYQQDGIHASYVIPVHPTSIPQTEGVKTSPQVCTLIERPTFSQSAPFKLSNVSKGEIRNENHKKQTRVLSHMNTPGGKKGPAHSVHLEKHEAVTTCSSLDVHSHQQLCNNKENVFHFRNQVNSLCRHIAAIDLSPTEAKPDKCGSDN